MTDQKQKALPFSNYQKMVLFLLSLTLFTVMLDFVIMSPLSDIMMKSLKITASQFGVAVSSYAFSAGISGLLAAGFADRFDRKKLLIFFYIGFVLGTLFCGLAPNYILLVIARIFTGIFGGVIGAMCMTIVADMFGLDQRGKATGFLQLGFAVSQVLGIPIGLYFANEMGWQMPFIWIAVMASVITLALLIKLKPITEHLTLKQNHSPIKHLTNTIAQKKYHFGFIATTLLSISGFIMMPFDSAYLINNLKISADQLPLMYISTGIASLIVIPLIGKMSDSVNKFKLFTFCTLIAVVIVNIYARFSTTSFVVVLVTDVLAMLFIMSRMIPSQALISAIPNPEDRGAFMSINSSLQQMASGLGAILAGYIVVQKNSFSALENYGYLAIVASIFMLSSIYLIYKISKNVESK